MLSTLKATSLLTGMSQGNQPNLASKLNKNLSKIGSLVENYQAAFKRLDTDGSGRVTPAELYNDRTFANAFFLGMMKD